MWEGGFDIRSFKGGPIRWMEYNVLAACLSGSFVRNFLISSLNEKAFPVMYFSETLPTRTQTCPPFVERRHDAPNRPNPQHNDVKIYHFEHPATGW